MTTLHDVRRAWRRFRARPVAERARLVRVLARTVRDGGPAAALRWMRRGSEPEGEDTRYLRWCETHTPTEIDLDRMRRASANFAYRPLVSILTPVYNTDPKWLEACAHSVVAQAYPHWEWCLVNDGSTRGETLAALDQVARRDQRIRLQHRPSNGGISAATNAALSSAGGEYIGLLDHDDALLPHAVFRMVEALNREPRPRILYSDEDKLDANGRRCDAYFKPDWSPDLFLSSMFACHFLVIERALALEVGGFRSEYDFAQDYDFMLRLFERENTVAHVPDVLYHWRKIPESAALAGSAKPTAHLAAQAALADYLRRNAIDATIEDAGPVGLHRVRYAIKGDPRVSIVLQPGAPGPARQTPATRAIADNTRYRNVEFVTVASGEPILAAANGTHLLLAAGGLVPLDPSWLEEMLSLSQQPGIGAVGAKLYNPDLSLQHVGMVLGLGGVVGFPFRRQHADAAGYFSNAQSIRNCSAVSGACLMTRRDVFDRLGGFDERLRACADVDYCLKVWAAGLRVVFTPYARLVNHDSPAPSPEQAAADGDALRQRWGSRLECDPFYNPNLSHEFLDYRVDV